jgi:sulfate transport system permease protein
VGKTQTATLFVEERFQNFDQPTAYAMAFVLAALAIIVLISINIFRPDRER